MIIVEVLLLKYVPQTLLETCVLRAQPAPKGGEVPGDQPPSTQLITPFCWYPASSFEVVQTCPAPRRELSPKAIAVLVSTLQPQGLQSLSAGHLSSQTVQKRPRAAGAEGCNTATTKPQPSV